LRIQLEYWNAARSRGDASERARLFDQAQNVPTARNGDDSGRVHNEITIDASALGAMASLVQAERNLRAGVKSGSITRTTPDDGSGGGGGFFDPGFGGGSGDGSGGGSDGEPIAAGMNQSMLLILIVAAFFFLK
jgi:hypothetical protein